MSALSLVLPTPSGKYVFAAKLALRQRLAEPGQLFARGAFYVLTLFLFSRVWHVLPGAAGARVWYMSVCEWIWLSQPRVHLAIERDIRRGDISCALTRPCSYLGMKLSEAAGELALSLFALAPVGVLAALVLGGPLDADPRGVLAALVLALLASVLVLLCHALIGVCAFKLGDVSPLFWLFQKSTFVFGGLLVPLELYPDWLRALAMWSPFSAMLYGPAHMLDGFEPRLAALFLGKLVASIVLVKTLLETLYERATRALLDDGGSG